MNNHWFDVTYVNGICYQANKTCHGWEIQLTKIGAKHSTWLKSRRNGKNTFTCDFLYAKHYTTEAKALEVIQELINDNMIEHMLKGEQA